MRENGHENVSSNPCITDASDPRIIDHKRRAEAAMRGDADEPSANEVVDDLQARLEQFKAYKLLVDDLLDYIRREVDSEDDGLLDRMDAIEKAVQP